ncbi:MAG: DUF6198 family protein, partial [Oscillospiraceae bacterium]
MQTKNGGLLIKRIAYVLGLFLLALGVSVSIKSNLGVSPVNSLPYAISQVLGVDMGIVTTLTFLSYILLQFLLLRKEFKAKSLLQIICSIVFGYFVSFTNRLFTFSTPDSMALKLLLSVGSIFLIAMGMTLYLFADLIPMPSEGFMLAVCEKTGFAFHRIKVVFDCSVVTAAAGISFLGLHK